MLAKAALGRQLASRNAKADTDQLSLDRSLCS